jgi:hypothetical protein
MKAHTAHSGVGRCKPALRGGSRKLDFYDVREWFAADPSACVSDIDAQKILRSYEHPYRWWIKFPGKDEKRLIGSHFGTPIRITIEMEVRRKGMPHRRRIEIADQYTGPKLRQSNSLYLRAFKRKKKEPCLVKCRFREGKIS